jgi:predicted phage tail protein|tara:strand:- start:3907 stop:4620 length:714 start_codon:yes stop_codon:yes gene_type:complete
MRRNVYLQGELGEKFGKKFTVSADSYAEVFRCINVNRPEFMPFMRKCHEDEIGFIVDTHTEGALEEEHQLLMPIKGGDITISIAPAGSKSGIGKILAAIAIVLVIIYAPQIFLTTTTGTGATATTVAATSASAATGLSTYGAMAASFAANLALTGLQQIMAPDPAVDQDSPTNYIFSGGTSAVVEGDPIPVLYGELRVPGRPISIDILQGYFGNNNTRHGYGGGLHTAGLLVGLNSA